MRIGISAYNLRAGDLVELAVAADQAGFDSLWLGEHLVLPCGYTAVHPTHEGAPAADTVRHPKIVEASTELLDPLVALAAAAAATERIRLATGIYLLPLRHPLLTARAVATLADLSDARFLLGVGSGWLREEFDALGVPFAARASLAEESLEVLRAAFRGGPFEHEGAHFRFGPVQVSRRPVDVPLVLGGNSEAALARAARLGDAWFASGTPTLDEAARLRDRLARLCDRGGRTEPLPCFVRVGAFDPSVVADYEDAGFTDILFWAEDLAPGAGWSSGAGAGVGGDAGDVRAALVRAGRQLGLEPVTV